MTDDQIAALVSAAEKVVEELGDASWEVSHVQWSKDPSGEPFVSFGSKDSTVLTEAGATYIALAQPAAAMALVARLREAERLLAENKCDDCGNGPLDMCAACGWELRERALSAPSPEAEK